MPILTLQNLTMGFEDRTLFSGLNLMLEDGERLALVGANGCGKTTLLRLITGEYTPEGGAAVLGKGVRLGYAKQDAYDAAGEATDMQSQSSIYEDALSVFAPLLALEQEQQEIHDALLEHQTDALLHRQAELNETYAHNGGLEYRARTKSALIGLGFPESEQALPVSILSGGQRAKLRLGRLLLSGADLLLLDEPTNHLDMNAIAWLEGFLGEYKGAVILVSHDRWFLDKVATRTAELHHGKLTLWKGGYSAALLQKETQALLDAKHYDNQVAEIKRIEGIIEQQKRFGQQRNFITIASKQKQIDRLQAELVIPDSRLRQLHFEFPPVPESGNEVLRIRGLCKGFGEKLLFAQAEALIEKGERVFILGANGCGKTTLLNILRRKLKPDAGYAAWGANVHPGSYDQNLTLTPEVAGKTVLDALWDAHRSMTMTQVRSLLGAFLFPGEDVFRPMGCLSGGERARVELLQLLLSGANVLLLDEPTNHLDIASREALEAALADFGGTILAVSHDRYFISKLATKIFRLHPGGLEYCGASYAEYEAREQAQSKAQSDPQSAAQRTPTQYQLRKEEAAAQRRRQTALTRCESEIARLEAALGEINQTLAAPEAAADYEALLALTAKLEETQAALEEQYGEWVLLSNQE
ncbi:MAG: ABC-F family ATP-binding cassette domain-containing protein [Oscillospiraceae bacterium]|jgi:ATP-binding cassette subfamily F protein 3|nr:ABC-F family ATP-binding cassette domain-containing protein [Oscillospiraceae bacterium]